MCISSLAYKTIVAGTILQEARRLSAVRVAFLTSCITTVVNYISTVGEQQMPW